MVCELVLVPPVRAAVPERFIRTWQTEDGLPGNSVNAIVRTQEGYLWLGTHNGLARFDGARFTVFDAGNTPELQSSRVTSLFEDSQGRLWIGHETGELTRLDHGRFQPMTVGAAVGGGAILGLAQDAAGEIWLLNNRGTLIRVSDGTVFAPPVRAGLGASPPGLTRDQAGRLWVVRDGELGRCAEGQPQRVDLGGPGGSFAHAICASRDGGLWVLVDMQLRKFTDGHWAPEVRPCPIPQPHVTTLVETASGAVAVGTLAEGLFLLAPGGAVQQFSHTNGLSDDWIRALYEDREGNLWVGTASGGLAALLPSQVERVNPPDRWQGKPVLGLCATRDGALWAGTEGAGVYRLKDGAWSHFAEPEGVSNLFVWSVAQDREGRLWAGTWGGGLLLWQGARFEPAPGLAEVSAAMPALLPSRGSGLWVGTTAGLLGYDAGHTNWIDPAARLALPDVRAVVEDGDGVLWFGMMGGGLGRLQDGVVRQFRKRDGLASDFVQALHRDAEGVLWIGTFGGGLCRLKQDRFATLGPRQGLPSNVICALAEDDSGHLWLSSHGGICRVSRAELNRCADGQTASVRCDLFGKGEGLPTLECSGGFQPAVCTTPDGRLWFPTRKGLVAIRPDAVRSNTPPAQVLIEEVEIDGRPVNLPPATARLTLQPGQARLAIRYTGLCFATPDKLRFRHRLQGLASGWVEAGDQRTASYAYLPPGHYTFQVAASTGDGAWSPSGPSLALEVLPHFWQRWWFRIVVGAGAVSAIIGVVLLATRRRVRRKLDRLDRQRALERERTRIARDIHDDLGASLTRITMLSHPPHDEPERPEEAAANLGVIYQTARELTRALDEIVWAVNPQHDTLDSLATYLGKFAQDFLRPAGIRCRLEMPLQLPALPLTAEVRHNLFLAVKEALNNVVKHSGASEARITLTLQPAAFALTVEDNGCGFTPAPPGVDRVAGGNGLVNLRRRLEEIAGQCDLRSAPGGGTRLSFTIRTKP